MSSALIIGAGIAGLTAARELTRHGWDVIVLDKGRGVGGRMATRHIDTAKADHGAQYFSATTPEFQQYVASLAADNVVTNWQVNDAQAADPSFSQPWYIGKGGMSAIAKYMAEGLSVRTNQKVVRLMTDNVGWRVETETGGVFSADVLLITIPAPQALALLHDSEQPLSPADQSATAAITYQPCLAVLATLSRPSRIPAPGAIYYQTGDVTWIADNQQKGISSVPSVTIHASAGFSQTHLDSPDMHALGQQLLTQAADWIEPQSVVAMQTHRWRYSRAEVRHPEPFLVAQTTPPLLFGGDGFGMGNIEGAFISGLRMAQALVS